jgi:hypothetical protein
MFVNKEVIANPDLEIFKEEVKQELASQRAKQEDLETELALCTCQT